VIPAQVLGIVGGEDGGDIRERGQEEGKGEKKREEI
jgi:hypothetical protein